MHIEGRREGMRARTLDIRPIIGNILRMKETELDAARAEGFGSVFFLAQHLARQVDSALEPLGLTTKQWLLLVLLVKRLAGKSRP